MKAAKYRIQNPQAEAASVAEFVAAQMAEHDLGPRDLVVLVRKKPGDYLRLLLPALAAHGIQLRNEAADIGPVRLQELLAEELSELVVQILRLAASDRAGSRWSDCVEALAYLRGVTGNNQDAQLGLELGQFAEALPRTISGTSRRCRGFGGTD